MAHTHVTNPYRSHDNRSHNYNKINIRSFRWSSMVAVSKMAPGFIAGAILQCTHTVRNYCERTSLYMHSVSIFDLCLFRITFFSNALRFKRERILNIKFSKKNYEGTCKIGNSAHMRLGRVIHRFAFEFIIIFFSNTNPLMIQEL